jgi:hypothetical protein
MLVVGSPSWLEGSMESMEPCWSQLKAWRLPSVQVSLSSSANGPPLKNCPFCEVLSSF